MTSARHIAALLMLAGMGCASPNKPADQTLAERSAACDLHCAELAMGLAEHGHYDDAWPPLQRAFEHAPDRSREDVPNSESLWRLHDLRLRVTKAVLAHHVSAISEEAALSEAFEAVQAFIDVASFRTLHQAGLTFLKRADRRWMLAKLDNAKPLPPVTRAFMTMVWQANSRLSVDRLRLRKLSEAAATADDHMLAAHVYCQIDECGNDAAVAHIGALLDLEMKKPDEDVDSELLEAAIMRDFIRHADERYRPQLVWLRDSPAARSASVKVAIPVNAYGRGEACYEFRHWLTPIVRESQASYEALVDASRCALALDYRSWGLRLLSRAEKIRERPVEALVAFTEFEVMRLHDKHLGEYTEKLGDAPEAAEAKLLLEAVRAVTRGEPGAPKLLEKLRDTPVTAYLRGLWAYGHEDWEVAARHLETAYAEWTMRTVAMRLSRAYLHLGQPEKALATTRRGFEIHGVTWALLHGEVAFAAGDDEAVAAVLELARDGSECTSLSADYQITRRVEGVEAADRRFVDRVSSLTDREKQRCIGYLIPVLAERTSAERGEFWAAMALPPRLEVARYASPWCSSAAAGHKRKQLAEEDTESRRNNLSWCLLQRGEDKAALETFAGPPESNAARDTYGRALIGTGRAREAVPIFVKLAAENPDNATYQVHFLIARILSGEKLDDAELDVQLTQILLKSEFGGKDWFALFTLMDRLADKGHAAQSQRVLGLIARKAWDAETWTKLARKCPKCVGEYRELWKTAPAGQ